MKSGVPFLFQASSDIMNTPDGRLYDNTSPNQLVSDADLENIDRDYSTVVFGHNVINIAPMTSLAFVISLIIAIAAIIGIFVQGNDHVTYFIPILTAILGLWIPSPTQAKDKKKLEVMNARMMALHRMTLEHYTRPSVE